MLENGAKSQTAAASTGKIASPRDQAAMVSPIIPDGSYPHHCRGIASVTSQITDVTITYPQDLTRQMLEYSAATRPLRQ